jgi:glycosyltransferase involved in cell wall biosynthesis
MSKTIRVVGALAGDIKHMPDIQVKYGSLFEAVARQFELVDIIDARLHGSSSLLNALQTFNPSLRRWQARYLMNVPGFHARSRRVNASLLELNGRADVVLQVGALFDATLGNAGLPVVVYTDQTSRITIRQPGSDRIPLDSQDLALWLSYEKQLYQRVSKVCVRASLVRRSLQQDYGQPAERIAVVGGGVNFAALPIPIRRPPGAAPTVLFIGHDFYRKGGDLALQAFARARAEVPEARMWLVTSDPVPPGLPQEGVLVLPPIWSRDEIADLYRQADVFILPSRQETWLDVLLEAMAFGVPCIGVTGRSMEEIIEDGRTGLLVPADWRGEALGRALAQLLLHPELRQQMGQAAHERVARYFTWDRVVDRMAPFIEAAAQRGTAWDKGSQ